jgi:hypothetical protein
VEGKTCSITLVFVYKHPLRSCWLVNILTD